MYGAALDVFAGETTGSEHITDRGDEAERTFRRITRHFDRSRLVLAELDQLGITRPQLFAYYVMARQFDRIADHAVKIARCVQRTDHTVSEELLTESRAVGGDARRVVEDASGAIITGESAAMARSALEDREHVVHAARSLDSTLRSHSPEEDYMVTRVLDSVVRTAKDGGNIAELALRTSLRT
jgi:phosphate uptake regulator